MHTILQDLRYALRSFRSGCSGLLISLTVVALAIGAGTITYSVVSAVVLRSLPYGDPDRLVNVTILPLASRPEAGRTGATMSSQSLELVASGSDAWEAAAYYYGNQPVLTGLGEPRHVTGWRVAPSFFSVLGAGPLLGRLLTQGDAEDEAQVVVLSHRFWASQLGRPSDVVGRTITLDGQPHEVVGVMPPRFDFPVDADFWQPAPTQPPITRTDQIQGRYWLVGRLPPDLPLEQALARLDTRFAAYGLEQPQFARWGPYLSPLRELLVGPVRTPLLLLLGAVGFVILIACANMAAVLLARGISRRRELAIRLSIGATRWRVARQLLTESLFMALLGGIGGVVLAYWCLPPLLSLMGDQLPRAGEIGLDRGILTAALITSILAGLLAGLFPALLALNADLADALKGAQTGRRAGFFPTRAGELLLVVQVGLGSLLMTGAAWLGLSFLNLMRVDLGFEPERALVAQFLIPADRYPSAEQRQLFAEQVLERASGLPGVQAAALSTGIPFEGGAIGTITVPDEEIPEAGSPMAWITHVSPDYFQAIGIGLVRGRGFQAAREQPAGVLVNESFARTVFPGRDAIGQTITYYGGSEQGEIIGVIGDTHQQSFTEASAQIYVPFAVEGPVNVIVRVVGDASAITTGLKTAIHELDPLLPIDRLGPLTGLVGEQVARQRFYTVVLVAFALIGLFTAVLGVYGLTAYSMSRRTREIGIRMAVGATREHIQLVTVGRMLLLAAVGLAFGLAGATALNRHVEAYLFGITPGEPSVFLLVAVMMAGAATLAAYEPARRASRVDPAAVLRAE